MGVVVHFTRFFGMSHRFLSNSPNPESAHQRYSSSDRSSLQATSSGTEQSTRRLYTDRGVETVCQKYTDRSTSSPASVDFARYSGFSEVGASQTRFVSSNDRFNDLALQRCGQSRSSADRFSSDHYVTGSSPAHDGRLSSAETSRYIVSSTERLLAPTSSSPSSSSETGKCGSCFSMKERRIRGVIRHVCHIYQTCRDKRARLSLPQCLTPRKRIPSHYVISHGDAKFYRNMI